MAPHARHRRTTAAAGVATLVAGLLVVGAQASRAADVAAPALRQAPYGVTELLLPVPATTSTAPGWDVRAPRLLSLAAGDPARVAAALERTLGPPRASTPNLTRRRAAERARRTKPVERTRAPRETDRPRTGRRVGPRVAYLTFDDGPSAYTPQVLRILTRHGATATFFVLGANAQERPAALRAIRRQGSAVGNHTWGHPLLTRLPDRAVRRQLHIDVPTSCFRPPYGGTNRRVVRLARKQGLRQVLWTADSRDWEKPGRRAIRRKALRDLHPGSIILMHDGGGDRSQTVAALPGLLKTLAERGYAVRALPGC
ncbi:MAG: polysaccharide deacetylase family protein [Nocardioides sp.]|uniref:polysaccharide deacetylase family protein n=1 Tax=Nocardioides sp. TaxID=35761 RepID=UPI003F05F153